MQWTEGGQHLWQVVQAGVASVQQLAGDSAGVGIITAGSSSGSDSGSDSSSGSSSSKSESGSSSGSDSGSDSSSSSSGSSSSKSESGSSSGSDCGSDSDSDNVNLYVLTGIPSGKWAEPQKREWYVNSLCRGRGYVYV